MKRINYILEARARKGLTQEQLARAVGVDQCTVHGWEAQKWQPSKSAMVRLMDFFGISKVKLFSEK